MAVAATTFSIVAVFVPIAFMGGIAGQWFKPFALTIACSVLVSLFVSFSLDPMLSAYWPDPQLEAHERKNPIARALDRFNRWFDRQAERYKRVIAWALDHRLAVLGIVGRRLLRRHRPADASSAAAASSRKATTREINLAVETPPGSNLAVHAIKARGGRAHRPRPSGGAYTYTTIGSAKGRPAWTPAASTSGWAQDGAGHLAAGAGAAASARR